LLGKLEYGIKDEFSHLPTKYKFGSFHLKLKSVFLACALAAEVGQLQGPGASLSSLAGRGPFAFAPSIAQSLKAHFSYQFYLFFYKGKGHSLQVFCVCVIFGFFHW
jgi:hypothetical protein